MFLLLFIIPGDIYFLYIIRSYLASILEFVLPSLSEYYEVHCKSKCKFVPVLNLITTL
jgi:hypothetical protein